MTSLRLLLQLAFVAFLAFAYDLVVTGGIVAIAGRTVAWAVVLSASVPFFSLLGDSLFADAPTWQRRILLRSAAAVGYGLGTFTVLRMFP